MKNHDLKILFVLENYYPNIGGVEKLFKCLSDALNKKNIKASIITTWIDNESPKYEKSGSQEIFRYNFINRYLFSFLAIVPIYKKLKDVDFIHTTSYNAGLPAIIAGILRKKKVLITFHEVWGDLWFELPYLSTFSKWGHYLFEALLLKMPFHKFIAVSDYTSEMLLKKGITKDKIVVIKNGIEYSEINQLLSNTVHLDKDSNQYCYFGRLGISKGLNLLLPAWKKFTLERPESVLKLVIPKTPNGFLQKIKNEIVKLEIADSIHIEHELSFKDLLINIKESHAVIIPSYSEGFCFTATESIAMGVPVISSGNGALAEVVSGKHLTMKTFDAEGLANCMDEAMNGNFDTSEVKKFHLSESVSKYINLYATFKIDASV